ncbi:hypothetical protein [Streptomyces sp. NBC_01092]|uniref:hypothetical protein n=1 Tax=Streptomyces sp. NBC_01092 TaxID=2903748 RepID=UPI0038660A6B|nr:hypothetical protein OG254_24715 [Streptomyces sp. NBC_01092]
MDNKVAVAMQGFIALTPTQRAEFITLLNNYTQGTSATQERIKRESLRDWVTRVDLGPTTQTCPRCGR